MEFVYKYIYSEQKILKNFLNLFNDQLFISKYCSIRSQNSNNFLLSVITSSLSYQGIFYDISQGL